MGGFYFLLQKRPRLIDKPCQAFTTPVIINLSGVIVQENEKDVLLLLVRSSYAAYIQQEHPEPSLLTTFSCI